MFCEKNFPADDDSRSAGGSASVTRYRTVSICAKSADSFCVSCMKLWAVCRGAVTMRRSNVSVVTTGAEEEEEETWTPAEAVLTTLTTRVPALMVTGLSFPIPPGRLEEEEEEEEMSLATFSQRLW